MFGADKRELRSKGATCLHCYKKLEGADPCVCPERRVKYGCWVAKNKILVTGGAGYIGSVLVRKLLARGEKVKVIDKLYFGDIAISGLDIDLIVKDIRETTKEDLQDVKAIIHLASLSNDPTADFNPAANYAINTDGTRHLALLAKEVGISTFTFASSAAIYGFHVEGLCTTATKPEPQSHYAKSKLMAEEELWLFSDNDFRPTIFRQGTVVGWSYRMRYDLVVNTMLRNASRDKEIKVTCKGTAYRPIVDVNDVAEAHIEAVLKPEKYENKTFNLVGTNYSIETLALKVQRILEEHYSYYALVRTDFKGAEHRSYAVDSSVPCPTTLESTVLNMWARMNDGQCVDFDNPIYYNLRWMEILDLAERYFQKQRKVF